MLKKTIVLLLALFLVISIVSFSSAQSTEKVKLTIAFPGQDVDVAAFNKVIAEFYKRNPNIDVEPISIPNIGWADYIAKIKTMIVGGNPPDVVRIAVQGIAELVDKGLALPMDEYIAKYPNLVNREAYYPQELLNYFKFNGKLYGLIWDANNVVLHVNTKLVEEAGLKMPDANWNLDEFIKFGKALSGEKNGKKVYAYAMPHNYFAVSSWLFNNEASFFNKDMTNCTLDDPKAIEVFQLFQDMIYKYKIAPQPTPESNYQNQFISEQVVMITAGRWPHGNYKRNNITTVSLQMLPKIACQNMCYGGAAFSIMRTNTKNKDAAFKLAAFMSGEYSQRNYLSGGSIPTIIKVIEDIVPKEEPVPKNYELFIKSPVPVKVVESPIQYGAVESVFNRYYSALLANEIDAKTACLKMKAEIDALLK